MPEIQTIHYVYRPQPSAPGQPSGTWGSPGYPQQPQQPSYPTYPQQPSYPTYPQQPGAPTWPQQPGGTTSPYPGYPQPHAPGAAGAGMLEFARPVIAGAVAGLMTIGKFARTAARRYGRSPRNYYSPPRGYGASYYTPRPGYRSSGYRSRSTGRAKVGMSGNFSARVWGAIKTSVVVGAVLSVVTNGYAMAKGQQNFAQAGSNVVGDIMCSVVGAVGGAVATTVGTAILAGVVGTGFGATLLSLGLGIGGYMLAEALFRKTGIFQGVTGKVLQALGGAPATYPQQPGYPGYPSYPQQPGYPSYPGYQPYSLQSDGAQPPAGEAPATNAPAAPTNAPQTP